MGSYWQYGGYWWKQQKYYVYNKGNYKYITDYLKGVNWVSELQELDVEGMWEVFLNKINYVIQQHVPLCKNNGNRYKYPKWMIRQVRCLRKYKL